MILRILHYMIPSWSDDAMEGGMYCAGVNDHCYEDNGLGIKYVMEFVL